MEKILDSRPIIVAGLGRLGLRIVLLLSQRGCRVRVITDQGCPVWHTRAAVEAGAQLYTGDFRDPAVWTDAGVTECQAAVVTSADDSRNLETSIRVKTLAPQLRMVTRVDAPHLGQRLQRDFQLHSALCPAALSAAEVVKSALKASQVQAPHGRVRRASTRERPSWQQLVLGLLGACLFAGTLVFHFAKGIDWLDATYFTVTVLTTVGFGDFHLQSDPDWLKVFGMVLMLAGITLIALLVSLFSHFLITGAAGRLQHERAAGKLYRHTIVAGMGSLGLAVVQELLERGEPVVCIELNRTYLDTVPLHGVAVIEGDATQAETLLRAGIDRARVVIAVTSKDGTNLEVALRVRCLTEKRGSATPLPVILSCQDHLMADRLRSACNAYHPLSPADLAAPTFVEKALNSGERGVT